MRLALHDRRGPVAAPDPWRGAAAAWDRLAALAAAVGPIDWAVELVLVTDEAMAALNARWRDESGPTDVLSFSYLEHAGERPPDLAAGSRDAARDLWLATATAAVEEVPVVGELVLAPAFVLGRCRERNWDQDHEWPLLVVHGCLHLLGWEHEDENEGRAMQEREAALLASRGLPHPLLERS